MVIVEQFWIVLSRTAKKGELLAGRRAYWKKGEVKVFGDLQAVPDDQHSLSVW